MAPLIPFYTINNVSISAKRSNFTLSYLEVLSKLILVQKENEQGQVHIFQDA